VTGKQYEWEFNVIDDPKMVNAFCLPGGKVVVYTGLLKLATTDDELAVVMGHEIAHATCRHGGARVTRNVIQGLGMEAAQILVKTGDEKTDNLVMAALGAGAQVGVTLPYSRKDEEEADRVGLKYMFDAGYDPAAAPVFWEKMAAQGGQGPPEWLSTHPDPANRMETLRRLAEELKQQKP
jgi:predicted Zn-dependent protease